MRRLLALLALLCADGAAARAYRVDDMLRLQDYGQVEIDPGERWAVVVKRAPYDTAGDYTLDWFVRRRLSRLHVVALDGPARLEPLLAPRDGAGDWLGDFSPSGDRLTVLRLEDRVVRAGILDMTTRRVRWLGHTLDLPRSRPQPLWVDEQRLLLVALDAPGLPPVLDAFWAAERRQPELWAATAAGRLAATELGSGRYLGRRAPPPARRLLLVDAATGAARPLLAGEIEDVALSADRRFAAVVCLAGEHQPTARDMVVDPSFQTRRRQIAIVELATGRVRVPRPHGDALPHVLAWSPAGHRLLVVERSPGADWTSARPVVIDAASGASRLAAPGGLRLEIARAQQAALYVPTVWLGDVPLARALGAGGRPDWYALEHGRARNLTAALARPPDRLVAVAGSRALVEAGGRLRRLSLAGIGADMGEAASLGRAMLDVYAVGNRRLLNPAPPDAVPVRAAGGGARLQGLTRGRPIRLAGPGTRLLAFAAARGVAIGLTEDAHGVGRLWRLGAGRPERLDTINRHLADVPLPEVVPIATRDAAGRLRRHWLHLPRRVRRPRLVVIPYPGLSLDADPPPWRPQLMMMPVNRSLLLGRGFAVLTPSLPLPGAGDANETLAADTLAALDAAVATGRVCDVAPTLYGHSYGGHAALAIAARTDRFAAVIASAAIADLSAAYGTPVFKTATDMADGIPNHPLAWFEGGQGRLGGPPWRYPGRYQRQSPRALVERLRTPLMLIHGTSDYVPVAESERLFMSLYRLGGDVVLRRYWGEGHQFASPGNIRDAWAHIFAFLDDAVGCRKGPAATPGQRSSCACHQRAQSSRLKVASSSR